VQLLTVNAKIVRKSVMLLYRLMLGSQAEQRAIWSQWLQRFNVFPVEKEDP